MQKVYVVTKKEYLSSERYVTVKATKEEAENIIFSDCSNVRRGSTASYPEKFLCRDNAGHVCIMYIYEETI